MRPQKPFLPIPDKPSFKRWVLFLLLLWHFSLWAQVRQYRFERFGVEDGLPSGQILYIYEDKAGFLWLGTMKGLVRYDGYEFKLYAPVPRDNTSLSNSVVIFIYEDRNGSLWICTHSGLNRYDRHTDRFRRYFHRVGDRHSLPGNLINMVQEDLSGRLWISSDEGSGVFDPESEQFTPLENEVSGYPEKTIRPRIGGVFTDKKGRLWASSNLGFLLIDTIRYSFKLFNPRQYTGFRTISPAEWYDESPGNLHWHFFDNQVFLWRAETEEFSKLLVPGIPGTDGLIYFRRDTGGYAWIVHRTAGLFRYHIPSQNLVKFSVTPGNPFGVDDPLIYRTFSDRFLNFWIGGFNALYKVNTRTVKFPFYQIEPGWLKPENYIYRTYEDQRGGWWFSTYDGRLFYADPPETPVKQIPVPQVHPGILRIGVFYLFSGDQLWLGGNHYGDSNRQGLFCYDFRSRRVERLDLGDTLNNASIGFIEEDLENSGYIWIGADEGLCRLNKKTHSRDWFFPQNTGPDIYSNTIHTGVQTHGYIWMQIGSKPSGQFGYFDKKNLRFGLVPVWEKIPEKSHELTIRGMVRAPDNTIWLASGQGLGRLDPATLDFALLTEKDGLAETQLMGIACDNRGQLWLKGLKTITRYDPGSSGAGAFERFPAGRDMVEFNTVGAVACRDGRILMHGNNGIYAFYPDSISRDTIRPRVVLTGFKILDHSMNFGKATELVDSISIRFSDRIITFEFAALHFLDPEHIRYRYRLDGFQDDWLDIGADRKVSFTHLRAGRYTFRVQACNADGVCSGESEQLSVRLRVFPPWWATWWAYVFYFLAVTGIIQAIFRFRLRQKLATAETLRLKDLDRFKTRLYTNITHEFRTPLTLILGPVTGSLEKNKPPGRETLRLIKRNAERLLQLINQMLDLSKLDAGLLSPHYIQADIVSFTQYIVRSFHSHAQNHGIRLEFLPDTASLVMDFDKEKWQTILVNLVSNAIKFTQEGGKVTVALESGDQLRLTVRDTGAGIGPAELPFIFDRFFQADDSSKRKAGGVGIGLALTKELTDLLNGQISVESEPDKGTVFTLVFPIRRTAPTEETPGPAIPVAPSSPQSHTDRPASRYKLTVLIIEDHPEAAGYIASCLEPTFNTLISTNGADGLRRALETIPDLIVCDVMMPLKDGLEVCKILKNDERTSHIPIILLTAKADQDARLAGIATGADAYLLKPFNEQELLLLADRMIELRRRLQERFTQAAGGQVGPGPPLPSADEAFLKKMREILEKHYEDHRFHVDALARAAGMSHAQLHRKLTALTGHSANFFIRRFRLEKARGLLSQSTEMNISEVAYDCGFASPAHFCREFKEAFGIPPTAYRATVRK